MFSKNNLGNKNLLVKKSCWSRKNFWLKKCLSISLVKKSLGKKIVVKKRFWSKNIFGKKKRYWFKKFCQERFLVKETSDKKKFFDQKNFVKTFYKKNCQKRFTVYF